MSFANPAVRRLLLAAAFACLACRDAPADSRSGAAATGKVLRVVRSKQLSALAALDAHGGLERALAPLGYSVQWLEFLAGPQQFEAFNAGVLDITSTAESPPVFAQAANGPVTYLAKTASNGALVSLLVPHDSKVQRVSDLRGKKVAFQKSSIGHYLLIRALEREGMKMSDVESVNLAPPDANVALSNARVDAWFIWEPFVTRAVAAGAGRVILDGAELRDTTNFFSVTTRFAQEHPDVLKVFLEQLQEEEQWCASHPRELADLLATRLGLDLPTAIAMHAKTQWGVFPIDDRDVRQQQKVADLWLRTGYLPQPVDVRSGFLSPELYAKLIPANMLHASAAR